MVVAFVLSRGIVGARVGDAARVVDGRVQVALRQRSAPPDADPAG
jgi:hypothetical protein